MSSFSGVRKHSFLILSMIDNVFLRSVLHCIQVFVEQMVCEKLEGRAMQVSLFTMTLLGCGDILDASYVDGCGAHR
jgi:hypothetical protein